MMRGIGLASAIRTLTLLPVPGKDCLHQGTTLYWFPVVGAILGAFCYTLVWILAPTGSPMLSGALVVAMLAFLTRAFHLDGLADTADGFGGGWTKPRILEIMKDSHSGAFGVVAVCLTLIVKTVAVGTLCVYGEELWVFIIPILSRYFLTLQAVANPYARPEGGTAGILVNEARWWHAVVVTVEIVLPALLFLSVKQLYGVGMVCTMGLLMTAAVAWKSHRKLGGVTGDVLGATCELAETAMFVAAVWFSGLF